MVKSLRKVGEVSQESNHNCDCSVVTYKSYVVAAGSGGKFFGVGLQFILKVSGKELICVV